MACSGNLAARIQIRSATLINGLGGRDVRASDPLDRQVKVALNEIHTSHPRRTVSDWNGTYLSFFGCPYIRTSSLARGRGFINSG